VITVIDYGAGNLRSVENALRYLDVPYQITSQPADVASARSLLLPGVGHFGQMMRSLGSLELVPVLRKAIRGGVPYLGICLGMQALFERSEEASAYEGLSIFPGTIRRFPASLPAGLKIPHMGWNRLEIAASSRLFRGVGAAPFVYFAHSYYLPADEANGNSAAAATCDYGQPFVAAVERDNIFGVQFHPEKSGAMGLQVVANFAALCGEQTSAISLQSGECADFERKGGERAG
jgi:imidazole glycerol phosphate synthase glutamine amidotransferase subunit